MKKHITLFGTALMFSICLVLPNVALGQAGSLDLSFGTNGFVITPVGTSDDVPQSVAIQSDGKIVAAGYYRYGPWSYNIALVRYNTNGNIDTTFNHDGKVITPVGTSVGYAFSVAIQSDGKIVVAGYTDNGAYFDIAVVRYSSNGSLDTTFDSDGIVTADIGTGDDQAYAVAIQSDGKILVAGSSFYGGNSYFTLIRYNTNGSYDTAFDTDGIVTTTFGNTTNWGYAVAIQNDGKILVAGLSGDILYTAFALARYNTDGSLDTGFDTDGKVTTAIGTESDGGYAVAIQSDGKIVVAGYSDNGNDDDFALVRYNINGSLDITFDTDGIIVTPFGSLGDVGNSVAIQSDGKIVVAGYSLVNSNQYDFALVRYNTNGSLDTTLDTDGKVTSLFGSSSDRGYAIALQSDSKIVMVGYSTVGSITTSNHDFAIARYNNNISTGINKSENQTAEIKIYPNPFTSSTTIQTDKFLIDATLTVYNIYGQEVNQLNNLSGHIIPFERAKLPNGLYFIQLTQANKTIAANKIYIVE